MTAALLSFRPRFAPVSCSMASDAPAKPLVDRVVIVGGGLGGLAAAIQLRKVGIDAQVYERGGRLTGGEGTLLSLFPNGCKSLNQADPTLVNKVREAGRADGPALMINPVSGDLLGSWALSERMEKTYGQPVIAILWRNLLKILSDTLPDECKHFGYECLDVTQDEEGATVHFKKDDETVSIKAPLVLGADGIRSVVRSKTFGDMTPRDNGRTMWRAVIDASLCDHPALRVGTITAVEKGKTMFVINGVGDKLYWAYSLTDESTDGRAKVRSKNLEEAKERLRTEFQGWDLALHILEATDPELILERRVLDLPVLTKWTNGRVAVLGDAAHAVTPALGQGANLAFEDGLELAIQLTTASDLSSALKTYEERRIPRAQIVSARTRATGVAHPQSFYDWLYNETPSIHDPVHYEY
ncbi:hypothetical protein M758_1G036300 [Ceratodon purpureus]|uniref:FAD-binding domain-containing protein n=1 Tax=Ceratodon purpureus TaxID=3225 RepID=A0A8T0J3R6_CERPU|nr:hypothetical protein KC19_1G038100 [Ceratodon purpureus]KAG0628568.1 hypothetical protein M758_1G036300 [Ceratodon purpureus]